MASMSSAQIVSASVLHNKALAAAGMPAFNNENQGYPGQVWYVTLIEHFYPKIRLIVTTLILSLFLNLPDPW